jgi:excisionase family DNA binding protein
MNTWSTGAEGAEHSGRENTVVGRNLRERSDADLHELLTVGEVAALLKVSRSWVYEHTRARGMPRSERLPHIKIGKYVRFEPRAVRAFIERKCRTT